MMDEERRQRNIETCKKWRQDQKEKEENIEKKLASEMMRNVDLKVTNSGLWEKKERLEREINNRSGSGNDYYGSGGGLWG